MSPNLNQIAVGSPPGATNYVFLLQGSASLKRLGTIGLGQAASSGTRADVGTRTLLSGT